MQLLKDVLLKRPAVSTLSSTYSLPLQVCLLSAVLSAFVTNDANCLVITPLVLNQFLKMGRSHRELLPLCLGIATSANIGSAATIFGNPQNAFIASAAGVSLLSFFIALLPAALIGTAVGIILLYLFFFKLIFFKSSDENDETESIRDNNAAIRSQYTIPATLAEERESVALSYDQSHDPYHSSQIAKERGNLYHKERGGQSGSYQRMPRGRSRYGASPHPGAGNPNLKVPDIHVEGDDGRAAENGVRKGHYGKRSVSQPLPDLPESQTILGDPAEDDEEVVQVKSLKERSWRERLFAVWLVFITFLVVILLAIPPPPTVKGVEFNLGLVPLGAGIFTMFVDTILNKKYAYDAMLKIDWTVILLFMGLFVWLGGFQNTCFPTVAFNKLAPFMNLNKVEGVLLFSVFTIIGSNIFSNVPLVILIVNRIDDLCGEEKCSGPLPGLLLAWVSTIAGNFTLIGSIANLIVAEKARSTADYRLTFWNYLKFGLPSTCVVLFGCLPIVYFLGKVA